MIGGARRRLAAGKIAEAEAIGRIALAERLAAALLAVTLICMVSARYV
jgi:hypothetical protein